MGVFDSKIATATRLIAKYGQTVTWTESVPGAPADPDYPHKPGPNVETEHTVDIVFLPNTSQNMQRMRFISGSEVTTGSLYGLMAQVDFTPTTNGSVTRDGVELVVKSVDLLSPNGEKILYTVEFEQ